MFKRFFLFVCCCCSAMAVFDVEAAASSKRIETVWLAKNGKAQLPVVIATNASETIRAIAADLAAHLGKMAGGDSFEMIEGDGKHGIVLGTLEQFSNPDLNKALAIHDGVDGREAYAIRTSPNRVLLIGATEQGASHAAYRLLESLGCRWFFPAPEWSVVPERASFAATLWETDRPKIVSRRIWWGYGFFDRNQKRSITDYELWCRRNRVAQSRVIACNHAWQTIIADNRAVFDKHPEYLALVKGERKGPQFCVSNPEVRKLAIEWTLNRFRNKPELDMVSLETADGNGHCECDACKKMGNISDRVFGLANEAARAVAKEFPNKMIGLYAYNDHCEPPLFDLEKNVYVQSTAGFIRGKYTFDELIKIWPQRCKNMGFYEYFSVWLWDFDMLPGGRGADVKYIRKRLREYAAAGATSIDAESGNNWGVHGRGYYAAAKLMWNPDADMDALLADFYEQAFGPAAEPMRRYYERLDPGAKPLLSEHLLALALRDLEEASKLAANRPDVLARLRHLKQYQHYARLRWDYERASDKDMKKSFALQAITHVYRARYSYMNHWEAIRQSWLPSLAKEFDAPDWIDAGNAERPWKNEDALDDAETERQFQEDLTRFQPQSVDEVVFSNDLVPAQLSSVKPEESQQGFQGSATYALWSSNGEPLELAIRTGVIAWYRDRPEAVWALTDKDGKELASGRLPQDGEFHDLRIEVPGPGAFRFTFRDQSAGWGIRATAGRPVSLVWDRGASFAHFGQMQRMYFFVPKGTRQLLYYWKGRPHEVNGPDGEKRAEVSKNGDFVAIDVPEGEDGRAWSFTKLSLGSLWFFNAPNVLAASPDALLAPRELVTKSLESPR